MRGTPPRALRAYALAGSSLLDNRLLYLNPEMPRRR